MITFPKLSTCEIKDLTKWNVSHLKISLHLSKSFGLSSESSAYQTEHKEHRKISKKNVIVELSAFSPQKQGCWFSLLPFVLVQQIFVID